jgi:hypothetical protein
MMLRGAALGAVPRIHSATFLINHLALHLTGANQRLPAFHPDPRRRTIWPTTELVTWPPKLETNWADLKLLASSVKRATDEHNRTIRSRA